MSSANKGPKGAWVNLRRNDKWYVTNKVLSVLLSAALAGFTIWHKPLVYEYSTHEEYLDRYDYTIIYWVLFIFYSF